MDIVTDAYTPQHSEAGTILAEKMHEGKQDILPYLETVQFKMNYTANSDIVVPSVQHFDSVIIFQPCRSINNATNSYLNNGQAVEANQRAYTSWGQFLLFGNSAADAGLLKTTADSPVGTPAGSLAGITSVQMLLGGKCYPSSPIQCSKSQNGVTCLDPSGLYYEYLKGIGKLGMRDLHAAMPYDVFRTTMPFIYLRPWSDNVPTSCRRGQTLSFG